jgi:hypothetical protein
MLFVVTFPAIVCEEIKLCQDHLLWLKVNIVMSTPQVCWRIHDETPLLRKQTLSC